MIKYNKGHSEFKNWIVSEVEYKEKYLGKTESTFLLANGYIGVRSANEESTSNTTRNTFISGTFNQADENEVTELPNINDIFELDLFIDGEALIINDLTVKSYDKSLNVKNGLLTRDFIVVNGELEVKISTKRFVSLYNLHNTFQEVKVVTNKDVNLEFHTWINGQVTNSGAQHFKESDKRLVDGEILQAISTTCESEVQVATHLTQRTNIESNSLILMDRRKVGLRNKVSVPANEELIIEKIGTFTTSIDLDSNDFIQHGLEIAKSMIKVKFDDQLKLSEIEWRKYWDDVHVSIVGDDFTQLSVRYAQYQLRINTPYHDERMNIGAKGLSGEGYKGHTFWDTELFMLPYFIFTQPETAKKLVKYRYLGLEGARLKANENDYEGAMYPWEAAWPTDGEVTPLWGAADIITGEPTKIWSGIIEQHITSDVIYGLWLYYNITGDLEFLNEFGYEMVFDTANFWASRVEKSEKGYVINNVIGPDEYKEHIDNNSFTNYMAKWNLELAIDYLDRISEADLKRISSNIKIQKDVWKDIATNMFLQVPNQDNILPQDDTYLTLDQVDLSKYKNQENVGSMFHDYALSQVNKLQVSKQADVMILFLLMEDLFSNEVKVASWDYYEPRTLHDSSLSLSTHVVLAQDLGRTNISEELFKRACMIDIGPNMKTSDAGIHTASLGGIWQGAVYGFGGVRFVNGQLRIEPSLHSEWEELKFPLYYKSNKLVVTVQKHSFTVNNEGTSPVEFVNKGEVVKVDAGASKTLNCEGI